MISVRGSKLLTQVDGLAAKAGRVDELVQGGHVAISQIHHVDVVTDGGTIWMGEGVDGGVDGVGEG